jgi:hypothetical protein
MSKTTFDSIVREMADDLRAALVKRGLDPKNPPRDTPPPTQAAFNEYRRRGGRNYTNADTFMADLIDAVKEG